MSHTQSVTVNSDSKASLNCTIKISPAHQELKQFGSVCAAQAAYQDYFGLSNRIDNCLS